MHTCYREAAPAREGTAMGTDISGSAGAGPSRGEALPAASLTPRFPPSLSLRSQPGPAQEAPPARLLPPALHAAPLQGALPLSPGGARPGKSAPVGRAPLGIHTCLWSSARGVTAPGIPSLGVDTGLWNCARRGRRCPRLGRGSRRPPPPSPPSRPPPPPNAFARQ